MATKSERNARTEAHDCQEAWSVAHEAVKNELWKFEDSLIVGLALHRQFFARYWSWVDEVTAGRKKFSAADEEELRALFHWWLAPCDNMLDRLVALEKEYESVAGGNDFRGAFRQTVSLLDRWTTPTSPEFAAPNTDRALTADEMAAELDQVSRPAADKHVPFKHAPDPKAMF